MKKAIMAALLAAIVIPATPAAADPPSWSNSRHNREHASDSNHRSDRDNYRNQRANRGYDSNGRYREPRRMSRNDQIWRGNDGRYHCRRDNGTTGLIIGAALGGLAGHTIDGGRNRTVGTLIGAAGGGLLGRAVDRGDMKCR